MRPIFVRGVVIGGICGAVAFVVAGKERRNEYRPPRHEWEQNS